MKRISDLVVADTLTGNEQLPIVQSGVTKRVSASELLPTTVQNTRSRRLGNSFASCASFPIIQGTTGFTIISQTQLHFYPIIVSETTTYTKIGFRSAGSASSQNFEMAVYDSVGLLPDNRLVHTTDNLGAQTTSTIDLTLTENELYFICIGNNQLNNGTPRQQLIGNPIFEINENILGYVATGSTFPTSASGLTFSGVSHQGQNSGGFSGFGIPRLFLEI